MALIVVMSAMGFTLLSPSVAFAAFTRPFLRQIIGTTPGNLFEAPRGVAVDSVGNLWIGERRGVLDEFNPSGAFVETVGLTFASPALAASSTPPESLAIDHQFGHFYVTGDQNREAFNPHIEVFASTGELLQRSASFGVPAHVAVDNSTDPLDPGRCSLSECTVYVSHGGENPPPLLGGDGRLQGLEKFDVNTSSELEAVPFEEAPKAASYIDGNDITGTPSGSFHSPSPTPGGIAVDAEGNLYAVAQIEHEGREEPPAVYEYQPSGKFMQAFTGKETPGLGESHSNGGFGGEITGVAVDPISRHVLVSVSEGVFGSGNTTGAVDEFDSSGTFLNQITEIEVSSGTRKHLSGAFAITVDSVGDIYIVDAASHAVDVYGPGKFLPSLKLAEATERKPTSAVLNGSVNSEGLPLGDCHFEYVSEEAFKAPFANEVQTLTLSHAMGGEFTVRFKAATTAPIGFKVTAAEVKAALEAIASIGAGNVEVSGSPGGPYTVEFVGSLAHTKLPQLTVDSSALIPAGATATSSITIEGGNGGFHTASVAPCVPSVGSIPVDRTYHAVHAEIGGFVSGTTYYYRLVAATSGPLGGAAVSASLAFTAPHAPRIDSTSATNLSSTFADLNAQIGPVGADTSYHFEYDTSAYTNGEAHGISVPIPNVDIGSGGPTGGADASVLQHVGGLAPSTTYHFRAVAENEIEGKVETTLGLDSTFTTLPQVTVGLPDGRAYELLTPPNKGSAEDMFALPEHELHFFENHDVGYPSVSGEEFLLETKAAFGAFAASGQNAYVFRRGSAGWQMTPLASPSLGVQSIISDVFDPSDFSQVGISDQVGSAVSSVGGGAHDVSLVGPVSGPYAIIHSEANVPMGNEVSGTILAGASRDLSRIVLESVDHAVVPGSGAETQDPGSRALYEWTGGEFTLASVNSNGSPFRCGALLGQGRIEEGSRHNAVSADGSKIFFTAPDPYMGGNFPQDGSGGPGCWNSASANTPQLYMRSGGSTVEVSKPDAGVTDPTGRHPAVYAGASEDGSRVFFVTEAELTKDDAGIHDPELYEYDTETAKLSRISAGESGDAVGNVHTVPAISADGTAVYFTATGRLTTAAPEITGERGVASLVNLYRYDTSTATTVYVATISSGDYPDNNVAAWWPGLGLFGEIARELSLASNANWYTTPDGRYLLFATTNELVGYSTAEASPRDCPRFDTQEPVFGHCDEVYRYDAADGNIVCVSCDPSGAPPTSNAFFGHAAGPRGPAGGSVRAMSDDGSYAFFDTADALVPQDSNGTSDVYEWHNGHISLISSGHDAAPSYFLGASADGSNVFFGTHARLVPQDTDTAGDIYDARICTESDPCIKPPAGETAQCEGGACQTPPLFSLFQTPATNTLASSGNFMFEVKPPVKLTNAQKLTKALKACGKMRTRGRKKKCEAEARRRYGKKAKKSARARHASSRRRAGR
jgi:hypothetical protein